MKVYNHLYCSRQEFNIFINGTGVDREKKALVRIHSSTHSAEEMSVLAREIMEFLPNAKIIGCSAPGIIFEGKLSKDSCLVSIAISDGCDIETFYSDAGENEKELCSLFSEKLIRGREGFLLLFLPASYTKGIKLVELMNTQLPGVQILGGAAGSKRNKRSAFVLEGVKASGSAVAAAFVSSEQLKQLVQYPRNTGHCGIC